MRKFRNALGFDHTWSAPETKVLLKLLFDILDACEIPKERALGMIWLTNQSLNVGPV